MFYDESVRDTASKRRRPIQLLKWAMIGVIIVLLAPFAMLAMAPALLTLLPLALVAIAFMVPALIGGGHGRQVRSESDRTWQLAPAT